MSIKNYLQKKKMQQGGSMLDAFIAEQMYAKIESLVEEEHIDKKKILIEEAQGLAKELRDYANILEKEAKNGVNSTLSSSLTEIEDKKKDCMERFLTDLESYTEKVSKVTSDAEKTVSKVLREIEKKKGDRGEKGADGKNGKDGSQDTALQIADKVNKEKEIIDASVIKGLLKTIEDLKRAIRSSAKGSGGGGGMGNVVTQSTAVSSATTSITLDSRVASNGKAIWFNYQGQQQAYGTHFTVSERVITLLFTPDDNTYADIIYIRA